MKTNPTNGGGLDAANIRPAKILSKRKGDFTVTSLTYPKSYKFAGTANPRALRVLNALLHRPLCREALDSTAGASNGPDLVSELRDLFPSSADRNDFISCTRIEFIDRDGRKCRPGVYSLTQKARRLVIQWLDARRNSGRPHA